MATDTGISAQLFVFLSRRPQREKTCLLGFVNNKGTDQPAHMRSLISAYVVRLTESIMSRYSTSEISMF